MDIEPSSPPDAPAPDWLGHGPLGRAERRLAGLEHLAAVGIRLAEAFAEKTTTAANTAWIEPDCHVDPGIPFAGMVRVVRQTYALQAKFEKEERRAAAAETARYDPDRRARHIKRRRLVKDAVTEAIKDAADPSDAERLFRDLEERLHDEEADERFDDGPVGQVVARICKALGVSIDLSLYEDADVQPGAFNRDAHQQPVGRATSPQPAGGPASFTSEPARPDASRSSAAKPDTQKPPAPRPPDAHAQTGPRISGIIRPGEPSPLEKYLGPPSPQIPRWPR